MFSVKIANTISSELETSIHDEKILINNNLCIETKIDMMELTMVCFKIYISCVSYNKCKFMWSQK